jgi:predicted acetyltransferase
MEVKLIKPAPEMEREYLSFARDWEQSHEEITPYSARLLGRNYAQWLEETIRQETTVPDNFVPAHTYFLTNANGVILGAVNIRHRLNESLLRSGGHIGYGIRPSERRKGYAEKMLALALPLAKKLGISKALVTCDKQNTGSAKTILHNGGVLENEISDGGRITQRYWIQL